MKPTPQPSRTKPAAAASPASSSSSPRGHRNSGELFAGEIREIRRLAQIGADLADVALRFNVSKQTAAAVAGGSVWLEE